MTYRTETVVPGVSATQDEARYGNRYEAIGAAVLEMAGEGGGDVVVHADDCRTQTLQRACPCGPRIIKVTGEAMSVEGTHAA